MNPRCPLCRENNLERLEPIRVSDLERLYKNMLQVNIENEFGDSSNIDLFLCKECDLRFFSPFVTGSEHFYNLLQKNDWYYLDEKNEHYFAAKFIRPADHVLDIGCGSGVFSQKITSLHYTGLELNGQASLKAQKKGLTVIQSTIEEHAKNHFEKYDVVGVFQVVEHVSDIKSFLESSVLCLKPGGYLIVSVPSVNSFSRFVTNFILDMPPHHISRWSDNTLRNLEKLFPLELVEIWHEPLQEIHKQFYAQTIFMNSFFNKTNKEFKNIDLRLTTKLKNWISWQLGKLMANGLTHSDLMPRGISVTGVYRKISK